MLRWSPMYFVAIKNPKALLQRTMISRSSQTPPVYNGYKLSGRKKKKKKAPVLQCITMYVIGKYANVLVKILVLLV